MKKKYMRVMVIGLTLASLFVFAMFGIGANASEPQYHFYVVNHSSPREPFWKPSKIATEKLEKLLNIKVTWLQPDRYSPEKMVDLFEYAVAAGADGIATSTPVPEAFDKPIRDAIARGIPVFRYDMEDFRPPEKRLPFMGFAGWHDYAIGVQLAEYLFARGIRPKKVLIGIHEWGHVGLETRAQGFIDSLKEEIPDVKIEKINTTSELPKGVSTYAAYLETNPDVNVIMGTGYSSTAPAIKTLEDLRLVGKITVVSADVTEYQVKAIKEGKLLVTVHGQQELWLWYAITTLYAYKVLGSYPISPIYCGPLFVDETNVAKIEKAQREMGVW